MGWKRKDPRKDAASNLFSHQEVEKDSSNHAPKRHHQEVNKPSPILEPLRSKSSPLPLVPTPSSPVLPQPASVTPSASPVASLAVPVTPTAAPITSATRCVMESTKELSASHDPVGNVMGNLSRIEEKVDNLSSAVGNITEVLEKLANCCSCMKGLLKVLKTSNNLQATSKRKCNAVEEADNLVKEKGSTSRCLNSDIPVADSEATSESEESRDISISLPSNENKETIKLCDDSDLTVDAKKFYELKKPSSPSLYSTRLFELAFTWDEAGDCSTTGRGKDRKRGIDLQKLNETRIDAMRIHIFKKYGQVAVDWGQVLGAIDTKCHGVRNGNYDNSNWRFGN